MIVIHFRFQHTTFIQFTEQKASLETTFPKSYVIFNQRCPYIKKKVNLY